MHLLFADFLDSSAAFEACRSHWALIIDAVAQSSGQGGQWKPWISDYYADGKTPIALEDRPIISGFNSRTGRAFRIMQAPPDGIEEVAFRAWVVGHDDDVVGMPREELFISLILTKESQAFAQDLLREWMNSGTSAETIRELISSKFSPASAMRSSP